MRYYLWGLALAGAAFFAAPAQGQSVSGCGPTAISSAESNDAIVLGTNADCFAKARDIAVDAEQVRRARIAVLPGLGWLNCADENGSCTVPANTVVRFGANGKFITKDGRRVTYETGVRRC